MEEQFGWAKVSGISRVGVSQVDGVSDMAPACCLSLDGCGFFNSVVVRLQFNSVSVGSDQWLFSLVVIYLWLCKEASHVFCAAILTRSPRLGLFYSGLLEVELFPAL